MRPLVPIYAAVGLLFSAVAYGYAADGRAGFAAYWFFLAIVWFVMAGLVWSATRENW